MQIDQQKNRIRLRWEYVFVALFFVIAIAFVAIRGQDIYIQIYDNLDSNIAWLKMLKDNNLHFETDADLPFLGGISRNYFYSELKCYTWLYMLFSPFYALVIGWFLKIGLSILGFVLVGKQIFADYENKKGTVFFCGFLYGLLPTFPTAAFAFASLPLLLWMLILFYRSPNIKLLVGMLCYPLLSVASTFGAYICGFILVFFVIGWIATKKPAWRLLIAAFVLGMGYIATEWRLFYSMLISGVESIRASFELEYQPFSEMVKTIFDVFIYGHYHSGSLHTRLVLPVCGLYFLYINFQYIRKKEIKKIFCDVYNWLMVWLGFNCVMYGVDKTELLHVFLGNVFPPLAGFSFARTLWFNPFVWYFAFAMVLCRLPWKPVRSLLLLVAFGIVCTNPSAYNTIKANVEMVVCEVVQGEEYEPLTYEEFYSEDLFRQIKEDIGYDSEWAIAYGMHPAVLQYNQIATLDGYASMYPLEYKQTFRELIEPALLEDPARAKYFDTWGGRAYVFSKEVGYNPDRYLSTEEADLKIDPQVFRQMGGQYVFSRVAVKNAGALGLTEIGVYTNETSPYTIYVYRAQ